MANSTRTMRRDFYPNDVDPTVLDDDMKPYLALFQKPLTQKKCNFSKQDLAVMCKDPLHSPRLILYLIDFVKEM